MKTVLTIQKNKKIYSDWTLMQCYLNNDNKTFLLTLADKHSNDQIRFNLEKEDMTRLRDALNRAISNIED
jgi:hypothetical protein